VADTHSAGEEEIRVALESTILLAVNKFSQASFMI